MKAVFTREGKGETGVLIGDSGSARGKFPRKALESYVPGFSQAVQQDPLCGGDYKFTRGRGNVVPTLTLIASHEFASIDECAAAATDLGIEMKGNGTLELTFDGGVVRRFAVAYSTISFSEVLAVSFKFSIVFTGNPI